MKIRYEAVSNVGLVRTNNEDMALVFGEYIRDNNIAFAFDLTQIGRAACRERV